MDELDLHHSKRVLGQKSKLVVSKLSTSEVATVMKEGKGAVKPLHLRDVRSLVSLLTLSLDLLTLALSISIARLGTEDLGEQFPPSLFHRSRLLTISVLCVSFSPRPSPEMS
jgi:hypothetical protein